MVKNLSSRSLVFVGLFVALVLAGVASFYASSQPDGLEKVAADQGIAAQAQNHQLSGSPLADYSVKGVDNARLSGGLAGVAGVGLTFALAGGIAYAVRRRGVAPDGPAPDGPVADGPATDGSAADGPVAGRPADGATVASPAAGDHATGNRLSGAGPQHQS